jgi:hypothetical protein
VKRTPMTAQGRSTDAFTRATGRSCCSSAVVFGSSFLLIEIGLTRLAPPVITFIRLVLGLPHAVAVPERALDG